MAGLDQRAFDADERFARDGGVAEFGLTDAGDRFGSARGADRFAPGLASEAFDQGGKQVASDQDGFVHRFTVDFTILGDPPGQSNAAYGHALRQPGLVVQPDDAFGGAATDVNDEAARTVSGQGMGGADPDQAGFFASGNDFDRESERGLEGGNDMAGIFRLAQGAGGDGPNRIRVKCPQAFAKALQRFDGTSLGQCREIAFRVQTGG